MFLYVIFFIQGLWFDSSISSSSALLQPLANSYLPVGLLGLGTGEVELNASIIFRL